MKLMPQPDGRIAIVFTTEEDAVLNRLGEQAGIDSRYFANTIYQQLMRDNAPDLVELIARMALPK